MEVVQLRTKSEGIQLTPEEVLEEIQDSSFETDEIIVILYNRKSNTYEWWQGGGLPAERILWHLKKVGRGLLE